MGKPVTEDAVLVMDRDEALKLVRDVKGRCMFMVHVQAFLPTADNMGLPGMTVIQVSRKEMLRVIKDACSDVFVRRGAKVRLYLSKPTIDGGSAAISFR